MGDATYWEEPRKLSCASNSDFCALLHVQLPFPQRDINSRKREKSKKKMSLSRAEGNYQLQVVGRSSLPTPLDGGIREERERERERERKLST